MNTYKYVQPSSQLNPHRRRYCTEKTRQSTKARHLRIPHPRIAHAPQILASHVCWFGSGRHDWMCTIEHGEWLSSERKHPTKYTRDSRHLKAPISTTIFKKRTKECGRSCTTTPSNSHWMAFLARNFEHSTV